VALSEQENQIGRADRQGAQAGLAPGVLTECFGEALFEVLDAGVEPGGAFVGGEQVGLQ
jgi:hypothetical protein